MTAAKEGRRAFWLALPYALYGTGAVATFIKLTFFDGYQYNWWNWIIVVPLNASLAGLWPVYWLIARPLLALFD